MQIDEAILYRLDELIDSVFAECFNRFVDDSAKPRPELLMGIGPMLANIVPKLNRMFLSKAVLVRSQDIEQTIREETEESGWYYAQLSPKANRKILALLRIGYEFAGSYSDSLFGALGAYLDEVRGKANYNLWDLAYYLDILLSLVPKFPNEYKKQISQCLSILNEGSEKSKNNQLKAYVGWLTHRASNRMLLDRGGNPTSELFLDEKDTFEARLWILFCALETEVPWDKVHDEVCRAIQNAGEDNMLKWPTKVAFLAFASSVLRRLGRTKTAPTIGSTTA